MSVVPIVMPIRAVGSPVCHRRPAFRTPLCSLGPTAVLQSTVNDKSRGTYRTVTISAALFIEFLRRLITNYSKMIFLVVDGLPAHKSVQRFLEGVKDRIRLFFLPPYAPEINPDDNGVGRAFIRHARDLHRAVNSRLRLLEKNPDKVRAFFQIDTTRYATAV
jgi:transposase